MNKVINPLQYKPNSFFNSLPVIDHNNQQFRIWTKDESYTLNGSCQCYHNCSCSDDRSKRIIKITTYYRNVLFDNTDKAFYEDIDYVPIRYSINKQ